MVFQSPPSSISGVSLTRRMAAIDCDDDFVSSLRDPHRPSGTSHLLSPCLAAPPPSVKCPWARCWAGGPPVTGTSAPRSCWPRGRSHPSPSTAATMRTPTGWAQCVTRDVHPHFGTISSCLWRVWGGWGVPLAPARSAGIVSFRPCGRCTIDHKHHPPSAFPAHGDNSFYYCSISIRGPSTRHWANACVLSIQSPCQSFGTCHSRRVTAGFQQTPPGVEKRVRSGASLSVRDARQAGSEESAKGDCRMRPTSEQCHESTTQEVTPCPELHYLFLVHEFRWHIINRSHKTIKLSQILREQSYRCHLKDLLWWWKGWD